MLQHYKFQQEDGSVVAVTIEDILESGIPIDPESGEDLEYLGPVEPYLEECVPGRYRIVLVSEVLEVDADSAKDAANMFREALMYPDESLPLVNVIQPNGEVVQIDIDEEGMSP